MSIKDKFVNAIVGVLAWATGILLVVGGALLITVVTVFFRVLPFIVAGAVLYGLWVWLS